MTPCDELPIDIFNDCEYVGDEFMRSFMEDGLAQQPTLKVKTEQQRVMNRAAAAKSRSRKREEVISLRLRCQLLEKENNALRLHCAFNIAPPISMPIPMIKIGIPRIA